MTTTMKKILFTILWILPSLSHAQLGIGTTKPHHSAALEIAADQQGLLPPRLTTNQRDNIKNPSEGLVIYNTTDKCLQYWNTEKWTCSGQNTTNNSDAFEIDEQHCFTQKLVYTYHNEADNYAIDESGKLWYWGMAYDDAWLANAHFPEGVSNYLHKAKNTNNYDIGFASPIHIPLPEPIKKIGSVAAGATFALSEHNKLYFWGINKEGIFGDIGFRKFSPKSTSNFPAEDLSTVLGNGNTLIDFGLSTVSDYNWGESDYTTSFRVIISSDGRAHFLGREFEGQTYSKVWKAIKSPIGGQYPQGLPNGYDATGFKYTRVLSSGNGADRLITPLFLEGTNSKGEKAYFGFGFHQKALIGNSNSTKNFISISEHPLHVDLPAGTVVEYIQAARLGSIFKTNQPNEFLYSGRIAPFPGQNIPLVNPDLTSEGAYSLVKIPTQIDFSGIPANVTINQVIHPKDSTEIIAATSNGLYLLGNFDKNTYFKRYMDTSPFTLIENYVFDQWTLYTPTAGKDIKNITWGLLGGSRYYVLDKNKHLLVYSNHVHEAASTMTKASWNTIIGAGTNHFPALGEPRCIANPEIDPNLK